MVESNKAKREFLAQHWPRSILFQDMAEMGQTFAADHAGNFQRVPKVRSC